MFIADPNRTQGDLNFHLFGIPVRIHPYFWLTAGLLGMNLREPKLVLTWVAVVFVSILVHELGHALMARRCGVRPWITLYAFGGLASYPAGVTTPRQNLAILFSGPGAGFALAAAIVLILGVTGRLISLSFSMNPVDFEPYGSPARPMFLLNVAIEFALYINIFWGVLNLLPIFPLDGGQISRIVLASKDPAGGTQSALILSVMTAFALVIYAVANQRLFLALMFGYLGYMSYAMLQSIRRGGF